MEEDQELRFVCKLCNKKYPSGKSLGGHMRSHVLANSSESDEKTDHIINNSSNKLSRFELGGGGGGGGGGNSNSGYVLRENPKKSWRAKDSPIANNINGNQHQQQHQQQQDKLMVCRQCGKGFQSLKALCGHMACHSDRERGSKDDDSSWNTENHQKMVTDSHSDTESDALSRRSSQMTRYYNNCSSSSEIDHEQEELALCLMMLSRESGKWVNMNSSHLVDSSISDHNNSDSVVSETKSYSNRTRILSDNSDSGYFMNEPETETDQKMESGYEIEKKKTVSLTDHREFQLQTKNSSPKKKKTASLSVNVDGSKNVFKRSKHHYNQHHHSNNTNSDDLERPVKSSKKMKGHVCPICNRVFKSGQALGGHKRSHFLVGASQERNHHHHHSRTTVLMKQEESESHDFLDLNLPPPTEE
ncbi:zinc finger protein ZAT9-like [Impatiens glandulifera]|uniref:zinc finger protein ZAT9-like n=1 Tax=Impatiens glandulifera TaxID=253017 RepID=UPI001FB19010|nr:zinc finger protein ZAT9-like [Impatiens glandulifera]